MAVYIQETAVSLPESSKRPLNRYDRKTTSPEEFTFKQLKERDNYLHLLPEKPAITNNIVLYVRYPKPMASGRRHKSMSQIMQITAEYTEREGKHYARIDLTASKKAHGYRREGYMACDSNRRIFSVLAGLIRRSGACRWKCGWPSPEPAVGVFTTVGTCQGRLRRHFVIQSREVKDRAGLSRVLIGWRVEAVGAEAGAGEEPQPCLFAELGEHVPGFDAEEDGEVVAAPVARRLAGDDGGDPLPAGGRPGGRGMVRSRRVRPGLRSTGGVLMAMSIAVMAAGWAGRPSSRLRYREVAHLTFRALNRRRRAGSSVASTARPITPGRSAGPSGQIPAAAVSWSLAASIAVVKLARSGSVPGRVSIAVTMAIRSSW